MRCVAAAAAFAASFLCSSAQAEQRMFIIANDANDYGVDRCLVSNAACGTTVANAYGHSHEYVQIPQSGAGRYCWRDYGDCGRRQFMRR
jgi:hypothetical protein